MHKNVTVQSAIKNVKSSKKRKQIRGRETNNNAKAINAINATIKHSK